MNKTTDILLLHPLLFRACVICQILFVYVRILLISWRLYWGILKRWFLGSRFRRHRWKQRFIFPVRYVHTLLQTFRKNTNKYQLLDCNALTVISTVGLGRFVTFLWGASTAFSLFNDSCFLKTPNLVCELVRLFVNTERIQSCLRGFDAVRYKNLLWNCKRVGRPWAGEKEMSVEIVVILRMQC
jgi:hypothetical protein